MLHLKMVQLVGHFENQVGTCSIFLQHIQQPLIWLVCMDPQLPEEVFEMMNFVTVLISVDFAFDFDLYFRSYQLCTMSSILVFTSAMATVG